MIGQEHYEQAERLIGDAHDVADEGLDTRAAFMVARAQVHATLALAQAVAMIAGNYGTDFGYTREVSA